MSRAARKGQKSSASTWRKRDKAHRDAEAERRRAKLQRRRMLALFTWMAGR